MTSTEMINSVNFHNYLKSRMLYFKSLTPLKRDIIMTKEERNLFELLCVASLWNKTINDENSKTTDTEHFALLECITKQYKGLLVFDEDYNGTGFYLKCDHLWYPFDDEF